MDTRDLAPVLLALSNLVEQINHRLSHDNPPVHLHFRAAKRGSLTINLDLQTTTTPVDATPLFAGTDTSTLSRILDILWDGGHTLGLFQLLKFLGGQAPQETERTSMSSVQVTNAFGSTVRTSPLVLQLATDARVKTELLDGGSFPGLAEARLELAHYVAYYNGERRRSALAYRSPDYFQTHLQPTSEKCPA
ncbi:hypothetical protein Hsw_PB0036 (plasmid) [Hymenobacter swuensis DY53]|uniref:Integrase catalytic domain-containing protein n=2 Tax=Hymenobacter TaxID=89966 RepID=W8EY81_9BACT|nr:hypothetical protein Hsw_PB0036 [Hymenobacter swuensis DY53]